MQREGRRPTMAVGFGLLYSVSVFTAACGRHISRVSRKLQSGGGRLWSLDGACRIAPAGWAPSLTRRITMSLKRKDKEKDGREDQQKRRRRRWWGKKRRTAGEEDEEEYEEDVGESTEEEEEEEDGVWRRTILMGEKCQPLDFSGVIYYDSKGRRLPGLPPRSPLRSPLPSFSFPVVVSPEKGGDY